MKIHLFDHFTYKKLLRFTLPSIVMMIFTSIYGVVDGYFVSNYAGKIPFSAINIICPFLMILGAFGFMIGAGGSALIAKTFGEGEKEKANRLFSMFIYITIAFSVIISILGFIFLRPIGALLGAEGEMLDNAVVYGRILMISLPFLMLQFEFQSFCVTAEKPNLGLIATLAAGFTNIILDAILVISFPQELKLIGAAIATAASQIVGGLIPLVYFSLKKNDSILRLGKFCFDGNALLRACTNGSSELLSNISMSIVSMLYNFQLIKYAQLAGYAKEDGVSAYGVLMYINFVFISAFIGFSVGTAPIIGYNHGANNEKELKGVYRKSIVILLAFSAIMFTASQLLAEPFSKFFVGYDERLLSLTLRGFRIFSFSFLFAGIAIFGSSFFTALNNGLISAVISSMRTLVFQVATVMILPLIWDIDGIWFSIVAAEFMAVVATLYFLKKYKTKYKY